MYLKVLFALLFSIQLATGQVVYTPKGNTYQKIWKTNLNGMWVLTGWAAANISSSFIFHSSPQNSQRYFYQMNAMWNTVNLGLGTMGLIRSKRRLKALDFDNFPNDINKVEKAYRINSYIDVGYIATGAALWHFSDQFKNEERAIGFGQSIITQGLFLLGFDWLMSKTLKRQIRQATFKTSF